MRFKIFPGKLQTYKGFKWLKNPKGFQDISEDTYFKRYKRFEEFLKYHKVFQGISRDFKLFLKILRDFAGF